MHVWRKFVCVYIINLIPQSLGFRTTRQALNQPDVYETPGAPDDADTKKKYEDDTYSGSVAKLECGVGKSYESFRNKTVNSQDVGK